ncbi:flagellar protein FlaG [Nitrospira moscoviensis]|uniref:Putative Flagellar protein FlaG n=1 Tax=Nitrospira moscoviensis TaxID=42253 RepID=A0A0K2GC94_NITMO|nr:flagellar protein FlaG [Nitrospira moscoviensis]ALA58568.1 putative Flagellar protein FlaG [Nitrospira moscoviensis]
MIRTIAPTADLLTTPVRGSDPADAAAKRPPQAARKQPDSGETPSAPVDRAAIDRAVAQVSEVLDSTDPRLKIEVDDETDRVVVKIIKEESGEVIRQFPPEELLELEKFLSGSKGLLLQERA